MLMRLKRALLIAAGALLALTLDRAVVPVSAQAPDLAPCGTGSAPPCDLTGHKVVANPNEPTLYVLQVETKQGPRSFVANRETLERFARELLDAVEGRGAKNL
jgi:hypothetical protein